MALIRAIQGYGIFRLSIYIDCACSAVFCPAISWYITVRRLYLC